MNQSCPYHKSLASTTCSYDFNVVSHIPSSLVGSVPLVYILEHRVDSLLCVRQMSTCDDVSLIL